MEKKLLNLPGYQNYYLIEEVKRNILLTEKHGKKYIIKGKRDKERNVLETLRFSNEKRIYKALNEAKLTFSKFPAFSVDRQNGYLILEYIKKSDEIDVEIYDFILAYLELQKISPDTHILLDIYNQVFRGYFYRSFIVSLKTLSKKVSFGVALKAVLLFSILNFKEKKLSKKYWVHGDLNENNYFNSTNNELYFIDFENMFYTTKWPFAEIIGKCFNYNDSITFNPTLIIEYLKQSEVDLVLKDLNFYYQIRFASLLKSVHEIAQTKSVGKRKMYTEFLKVVLDRKQFRAWYQKNSIF